MKCVNCGAEVVGSVCEYCGSHYDGNKITASFDSNQSYGTLTIDGNTFEVYVADIHFYPISTVSGRDINGRLVRPKTAIKRRFTLIER